MLLSSKQNMKLMTKQKSFSHMLSSNNFLKSSSKLFSLSLFLDNYKAVQSIKLMMNCYSQLNLTYTYAGLSWRNLFLLSSISFLWDFCSCSGVSTCSCSGVSTCSCLGVSTCFCGSYMIIIHFHYSMVRHAEELGVIFISTNFCKERCKICCFNKKLRMPIKVVWLLCRQKRK